MTNYKDIKYQFPTSAITSGTMADARISEASVTQHVTATDLTPVRQDITTLALKQAVNENKAAFNLPNSFIDQFEDDTGIGTETNGDRHISEFWSTITTSDGAETGATTDDLVTSSNTVSKDADSLWSGSGWQRMGQQFYVAPRHRLRVYGASWGSAGTSGNVTNLMAWITLDDGSDGPASLPYTNTYKGGVSYSSQSSGTWLGGVWNSGGPYWEIDNRDNDTNMKMWMVLSRENPPTFTGGLTAGYTFSGSPSQGTYKGTGGADNTTTPMGFATGMYDTSSGVTEALDNVSDVMNWKVQGTFMKRTLTSNATGTLIGIASVPSSAQTKVSGVMNYKDEAGTASIGTDLKIYFTCDGGSNWTEASSYTAVTPVFSTGIKMVKLGETTCTSGSDVRYKAVWANQASGSKETQLYGIGVNY